MRHVACIPLNLVLRDCGINAVAVVGVAMEVGIEPTVRHAADLGYIPVIVRDACGAGHEEAAQRSIACVDYSGDAVLTDVSTIRGVFSSLAVNADASTVAGASRGSAQASNATSRYKL